MYFHLSLSSPAKVTMQMRNQQKLHESQECIEDLLETAANCYKSLVLALTWTPCQSILSCVTSYVFAHNAAGGSERAAAADRQGWDEVVQTPRKPVASSNDGYVSRICIPHMSSAGAWATKLGCQRNMSLKSIDISVLNWIILNPFSH